MTDENGEPDDIPMVSLSSWLPFRPRWILLGVVVLVYVTMIMRASKLPTGYTLGLAFGPVFWGLIAGVVVWIARSRKAGVFSGVFFWVTIVMTSLRMFEVWATSP
jgi:hypothetical protein